METVVIVVTVHNQERSKKRQVRWRAKLRKWIMRLDVRAAAWYTLLTAMGIMLYRLGAAYALQERGYYAVGGEALALLLPVLYYVAATTVRDVIREVEARRR